MTQQTFSLAASADDTGTQRSDTVYPPAATIFMQNATNTFISVQRFLSGSTYQVANGLLKWNTSGLPAGAIIDGATLRVRVQSGTLSNTNTLNLTADWYTGAFDNTAYTSTPGTNALAGAALSGITENIDNDFTLSNAALNINPSGNTALRLHISQRASNAAPTGLNGLVFSSFDHATDPEPRLIVDYHMPPTNQPPVADFSFITSGLLATFTDGSSDPDGTIASRSWNFGDGNTSSGTNPAHTYAGGGTYTVTLTVTDNSGAADSIQNSVTVTGAALPAEGAARGYLKKHIFSRTATLSGSMDASQLTIPVDDVSYWPENGVVLVGSEKMTYSSKSVLNGAGDFIGVSRGQFGTTAATHSSGAEVGLLGRHEGAVATKHKIPTLPQNGSVTLQELRRHEDEGRFAWAEFDNFNEVSELEITGEPTSSGNVSVTLDENGVGVTRSTAVSAAQETLSLTINNAQTAAGEVRVTLNGTTQRITLGGVYQKHQVVIEGTAYTGGTFAAGSIIFLDSAGTYWSLDRIIPIYDGDSAEAVAARIRSGAWLSNASAAAQAAFTWTLSGTGNTIIATANTPGHRRQDIPGSNPPGANDSFGFYYASLAQTQAGVNRLLQAGQAFLSATQVAEQIRGTSFQGWKTGGTGTTVTFTYSSYGDLTGTHQYDPTSSGATSTSGITVTTNGARTTADAIATAIRGLYSGNTYWTASGTGTLIRFTANASGVKADGTFSGGTTGTLGKMETLHQGSADIVGCVKDSNGVLQSRRILANIATTTVFNIETAVSGAGTEKGIVTFWGSFGTDTKSHLWRVENLDLTQYSLGQLAYGVTSESSDDLTWNVYTDEVEPTNRGLSYYRDHNSKGELIGQAYYYGLLLPEQARQDIYIQEHSQPVLPGQEITLIYWLRYENAPTSLPAKPLYITCHHTDGRVTEIGHATNTVGVTGDENWLEYTFDTFTIPANCIEFSIRSRDMSQGAFVIQEIAYSVGTVGKRTRYYALDGTFRVTFDSSTPFPIPDMTLRTTRTGLETLSVTPAGTSASAQYRSSSDSPSGTWYTDPEDAPDLPIVQVEPTLSSTGLVTPVIPPGQPHLEYRNRVGIKSHPVLLKHDRSEFEGGMLIKDHEKWYPNARTDVRVLPSGRVRRQKINEPVGFLPSVVLLGVRPEAVTYIQKNWGSEIFVMEIYEEALFIKFLAQPKFTRQSLPTEQGKKGCWVSDGVAAEVYESRFIIDP